MAFVVALALSAPAVLLEDVTRCIHPPAALEGTCGGTITEFMGVVNSRPSMLCGSPCQTETY